MKIPTNAGKQVDPIKEDSYQAVCYGLFDLGTHLKEGQFAGDKREILLIFEIPDQRWVTEENGDEGPRAISKRYNYSMHEKSNLRKDLEGWRGKKFNDLEAADFELKGLLGKNCILHILHKTSKANSRVYANIENITKIMSPMTKKNPENTLTYFSFDDGGIDRIPETASEWVVNEIKSSHEYGYIMDARNDKAAKPSEEQSADGTGEEEDDLPF